MAILTSKKQQLAGLEANLAELKRQLDAQIAIQSEKQAMVEMCTKQLERATELIGGLGGEGVRWAEAAEKLGKIYETLTGKID